MIDHHVSFHRNRSFWAGMTNMAFLILNHVNNHHMFFHRNRSLWAIVTNLALLLSYEQRWGQPMDSHDIPLTCHNDDPNSVLSVLCVICVLCSVFCVLHGRLGPGARQPDLQVIMTTDQSTISQSTKTTRVEAPIQKQTDGRCR